VCNLLLPVIVSSRCVPVITHVFRQWQFLAVIACTQLLQFDRMASFSTVGPNVQFSTECEYKFAALRHILKSN